MTDARFIDETFAAALDAPEDEREAVVRNRCGSDEAAVRKVLSLLEAADSPDGAIEKRFKAIRKRLWQAMVGEPGDQEEDLTGRRIGKWSIQSRVARGGLATVYKAQRSDGSYQQLAAFKVLRRGLDTDDLITRFRAERQILSSLEHPSIASILDGGALDDGRPYLVLEFVEGNAIDTYCVSQKVSVRDRIKLMIEVSRGIHHAHQRQVVHRDIKPSNIMVTDDGEVRLLDFGIAKLLDPLAMPAMAPITRTGVSLQTPAYASPEQKAGDAVTTASDIYQLGRVLADLAGDEGQPDLAAIIDKATHQDPQRRYPSAAGLVLDLERYLDGLPVMARPDSIGYRLRKLQARQPFALPAIAVAVLAILGYTVTLQLYSERLEREQRLAMASQEFLVGLFRSPDPFAPADVGLGRDITVVEALDIGQRRIRSELDEQPDLQASLLATLSEVYGNLDVSDTALALREEALRLERELYGGASPEVVASLQSLGGLHASRGDLERGTALMNEQLALAQQIFDSDDPRLGLAEVASGVHANFKGNAESARSLLRRGIARLRATPQEYARERIGALIVLAQSLGLDDPVTTRAAIDEAIAVAKDEFGEKSLQLASARVRLASTLTLFGEYEHSQENFLAAIPVLEQQLGEDHHVTLTALNNLGVLYHYRGDEERAEAVHRTLLQRRLEAHGRNHRDTADSYQNLAGAITKQGRYDESIPLHRDAYDIYKAVLNDNHYQIGFPLLSISYAELMRGDAPAAEAASREALERFQVTVPGSFLEGVAQCLVGLALEMGGQAEKGGELVSAAHALMARGRVPDPYPEICRMPAS